MDRLLPPSAPLQFAEHSLLQVLLDEFTLYRHASGVHLEVAFNSDSDAIWTRKQKPQLQRSLDPAKIERYQKKLNSILVEGRREPPWKFHDPDFRFRYSNGGTLPIMNLGGSRYVCLFYRESDPVGWNIANGASDSISELVDPRSIVERELREELIVVSPSTKRRFRFKSARKAFHLSEFEFALRAWGKDFGNDLHSYGEETIEIKWHVGSDSVKIVDPRGTNFTQSGFFLNINATDHGIEFDRIAEFDAPDEDVLLLDGEIHSGVRLGRPIGLFEISKLESLAQSQCFVPDVMFFGVHRHDDIGPEDNLETFIERSFVSALEKNGLWDDVQREAWSSCPAKFDLCPVTRLILERYFREIAPGKTSPDPIDSCFVSYDQRDNEFVEPLVRRLRESGIQVWYAPHDLRALDRMNIAIADAIREHDVVLLVLSENSIQNKWVETEVRLTRQLELSENKGKKCISIRLAPLEVLTDEWEIFDTDRGADIALEMRQQLIRDFTDWVNVEQLEENYKRLLRDIRELCAARRQQRDQ